MKRSPLNTPHGSRAYGAKNFSYWRSTKNANNRGYQSGNTSYQRFSVNNELQPCGDNFIPLNASTPVTQHEKHNANQYSPVNERISSGSGSGWHDNYKNNYHGSSRSNCNNRYSTYKHFGNQFHGQKRKGYKGIHRQTNISAYVDIHSFLEDPWESLVKKLNNSKEISKSETSRDKSSKLTDNDFVEKSESKFLSDTDLDDSQCSQESKNEQTCIDISLETENTDLSQISNSSVNLKTDDICSSQESLSEGECSNSNSKIYGVIGKDNICSNALTDTDQTDI